jgi:magnesium transporter
LVTFTGVYLLNLSRADPNGDKMLARRGGDVGGTDMISSVQTRLSMSARRSMDPRYSVGSQGDREGLMRGYDEESGFGLADLADDSDEEAGRANGNGHTKKKSRGNSIELQPKSS